MDMSVVAVIILCTLFEESFHQGVKLHIIYFNLTDINTRTVIILFSIHSPSIHTDT